MHGTHLQHSDINQKDLNTFKTLALIFAYSRVGVLIMIFVSPILEAIVNYIGMAFLIIGIFQLAKKYPHLTSGMKVVGLFIMVIIANILSVSVSVLYPTPQINTQNPQQNIQTVVNSFYSHAIVIFSFMALGGVLTLIGAYYFTEWFNKSYSVVKPTKSYLYYGIAFCIASVTSGLGIYIFAQSLTTADLSTITANSHTLDSTLPGLTIFLLGSFITLFAIIIQVIAGFKIFNRANDKVMGKLPFNVIQQEANMQPLQTAFLKNNVSNFKISNSSTSNPDLPESTNTIEQTIALDNSVCTNCGAPLEQGTKFCESCGQEVQ